MKPIKPGFKFRDCANMEWKVYTKIGEKLWSCLSTIDPSLPFTNFTEAQIQGHLYNEEFRKLNTKKQK